MLRYASVQFHGRAAKIQVRNVQYHLVPLEFEAPHAFDKLTLDNI